ncbi:hypothetical protein WH5701_12308 [Synechococcus sp. WH 5701]|nr:hypothetical protein WH5701_12308 [Synechococcus sp. WH 5701]
MLCSETAATFIDLHLFTQHQLSRRISFHLQTPVKIQDGTWAAPMCNNSANRLLIRRKI